MIFPEAIAPTLGGRAKSVSKDAIRRPLVRHGQPLGFSLIGHKMSDTLQAAILRALESGKWFRPVGWKGRALTVRCGQLYGAPTYRGGRPATVLTCDELMGEWEAVEPDKVNLERGGEHE